MVQGPYGYDEFTVGGLKGSPTFAASQVVKAENEKRRNVADLTLGDLIPKPTEEEQLDWVAQLDEKAQQNPEDSKFKELPKGDKRHAYSPAAGLPNLRHAVAQTYSRDTGLNVDFKDVGIGSGGKGTLSGAFSQVLQPGDVVFTATPCWPTNFGFFPKGVKIISIPTKDGIMRAEDVKKALKHYPNPKVVLINAPCNPTGANYGPGEREAFFKAVRKNTTDTIVASDDPYGKLVFVEPYDSHQVMQRGEEEKALYNDRRLAVFRSISKEYGLSGHRIGYLATKNESLLKSLALVHENYNGLDTPEQILAMAALLYGDQFIDRTMNGVEGVEGQEGLRKKRATLMKGITDLQYADAEWPAATIYGWIDFSKLKGKMVPREVSQSGEAYSISKPADVFRYLIDIGVGPVPGGPFFPPDSKEAENDWHVRATFCCGMKVLEKALTDLKNAEAKLIDPLERVNGGGEKRRITR
jgi:aspartate aminotransferase